MSHTLLDQICIAATASIRDAIAAIDRGSIQIALIVDADRRLLASVTDGDVRRGLLRGLGLDDPVASVMNRKPLVMTQGDGAQTALSIMRKNKCHQVPVVDVAGRLIDIHILDRLTDNQRDEAAIVLMAGGLGTRLWPLTETVPKPMLPVGGRPILEHTIRNLADQGFRRLFVSVNYKKEIIQDYFRDGSHLGVDIEYLVEKDKLGTAGALSLLPPDMSVPVIVMNGDILTSINLKILLDFHHYHASVATMVATEYKVPVPYGVLQIDGPHLVGVVEKPVQSYAINAGIYVLSPAVLAELSHSAPANMPDVFTALVAAGRTVTAYQSTDYWMDVGIHSDLERARLEYEQAFGHFNQTSR